ncbi:FAD-binding oxidoreductase [Sphingomonas lutea]|uniref:FAD-binding oxidoreductase n=1 Tax=Sphingomonas lutea TaxID=1045317 RepID=A0A7G9SES4_9SPHN|nr:FAD-dependent oxidoreductase [Sphingomonas lutea]QNN66349.1 FAD-binding oxidoreductase [Sphingomonas lutea]
MQDWDVIIIGGGIAGASLGAAIAEARRTLIVEAEAHCGYHATGRSAAFWLESYGGPQVAKLTAASRTFLEAGGFLRTRGALHVSRTGPPEAPVGVDSRPIDRNALERMLPGIRPEWRHAILEPGCADIDVAALHAAFLADFRACGGIVEPGRRLARAHRDGGRWTAHFDDGDTQTSAVLVNAAGAWADAVAEACGVPPLGLAAKRRTMVQLRVGQPGLRDLPLVDDPEGTFYFKGEGDRTIWLSPHDEIATDPCDAAPEEIDVAIAIDRFEQVVDWPVEAVERRWAGLRTFAPDRLPVYGFDPRADGFFWCAGQGGFGIQTSPAAARMAAALLTGDPPDPMVAHINAATFAPGRFAP